jgi:hypothetical protein
MGAGRGSRHGTCRIADFEELERRGAAMPKA